MTGIEEIAPLIGALAAAASAGTGIASAAGAFGKPGAGGVPKPPSIDTTSIAKSLLPSAKADTAAQTGGGFSPNFLAGILGQQSGQPNAGLDILGDIRTSLGGGGGIQAP